VHFYAWFEAALAAASASPSSRSTNGSAPSAPSAGLRRPELFHHRRLQRQRRDAALPRHRESHAVIDGDGLLLIDSGGQYLGGTTDITRVWPIGTHQRGA
jgi:Xaa-Pro aminopeptidase